ncbi:MAG TPA: Hpt domain-containing protein [bacterium]|nr:Hpt domain-containing protein [bacterium]
MERKDLTHSASDLAVFDPAVVRRAAEGDTVFERALLALFLDDTAQRVTRIGELVHDGGDPAALRLEAHTVKGSCGNIGAPRLREAASLLEKAAAEGRGSECPALAAAVAAEFERAAGVIAAYRDTLREGR